MRPTIVTIPYSNGVHLHLDVHDRWFMAKRKWWRRRLAMVHPDSLLAQRLAQPTARPHRVSTNFEGRKGWRFKTEMRKYRRWLQLETKWYASLGFRPPVMGVERECGGSINHGWMLSAQEDEEC